MSDRIKIGTHKTKYHQKHEILLEFEKTKKKHWVTVLLWLFSGFFGGHRFYLVQNLAGILIFGITSVSIGFLIFSNDYEFFLPGFLVMVVWLYEIFLVTRNTDKANAIIKDKIKTMHEFS